MTERVLVVDDMPDARILLRILLANKAKFTVLEAASGAEALHQAQTGQPDLIILDYMMPDIDGPELLMKIRKISATANIPVIMLTARMDVDAREKGLAAGVNRFIIKPIKPFELLTEVQNLLEQHKTTPHSQST